MFLDITIVVGDWKELYGLMTLMMLDDEELMK